jgi:hypothetical protein
LPFTFYHISMTHAFLRLSLLTVLALCLAGCGGIAQVPTPVPATATPAPTATPLPTATPAPTATPLPDSGALISAALAKTAAATSYRIAVRVSGEGTLQGVSLGESEAEILNLSGAFSAGDFEYALKGTLAAILGVDPESGLEIATVGGTSYMRGPVPFLGATEEGWYRLAPAQSALANPSLTAGALGTFFPARPVGFEEQGSETIDDLSCTIYAGDKAALEAAIDGLSTSGLPGADALADADEAELRAWVCEDGYMHRVRLSFTGSGATEGEEGFAFTTLVDLSDFGATITIDKPADARELTPPTAP